MHIFNKVERKDVKNATESTLYMFHRYSYDESINSLINLKVYILPCKLLVFQTSDILIVLELSLSEHFLIINLEMNYCICN